MRIQRAEDRGSSNLGWLQSRFSFSFADYHNPKQMGFGALRVLNDDVISVGGGFPDHPHQDMEIITIVTEGELEHKDSTGSVAVLRPWDVQVMSAGTGIVHSEFNSGKVPLKLFQIWIQTKKKGINPRHEEKTFDLDDFTLIASYEKGLHINQEAKIYLGKGSFFYPVPAGKGVYILVIDGSVEVAGRRLESRDAAELVEDFSLKSTGRYLLIEVPL